MDDCITRGEAIKFLGVTELKFRELLNSNRLNPIYSRTYPNPKQPGKLLEEHPDNEECYSMDDLRQLKLALDTERTNQP
jgi:hypothetical protein